MRLYMPSSASFHLTLGIIIFASLQPLYTRDLVLCDSL